MEKISVELKYIGEAPPAGQWLWTASAPAVVARTGSSRSNAAYHLAEALYGLWREAVIYNRSHSEGPWETMATDPESERDKALDDRDNLAADLAAARERIAALEGERAELLATVQRETKDFRHEWKHETPDYVLAGVDSLLERIAAALAPAGREGEVAAP